MRFKWIAGFPLLVSFAVSAQTAPDAHHIVAAAIAAMGGETLLRNTASLRLTGIEHAYQIGNAERAEGPWRASYTSYSDLWDLAGGRIRRTEMNPLIAPDKQVAAAQVFVVSDSVMSGRTGTRESAAYPGFLDDARDRIDGSPSRVLLRAAASPSLHWTATVSRFGVPTDVVTFTAPTGPVHIEINRESQLPTAVEIVRSYPADFRRRIFGDATTRIEYVDWNVQASGIWWPMQSRFLFDGGLFRDVTVASIQPVATIEPDSFAVADSIRTNFAKSLRNGPGFLKIGDRPEPKQPGDGIVRVADQWAMTLVKQDDGVVIFEAHLSDNWFKQIVDEAHRRWPGARIKAVVLTSDPWAHLGGLREAIAMGLPIYVNARSIPFLTGLAKRPWTLTPDDLARKPVAPHFIGVSARTVIGSGTNQVELYPVRGAYAERMTMAYFPARHLLYGADLVFADRSSSQHTFDPTPATELRRAVEREHLRVDSVYCVQPGYPIFAWNTFMPTGGMH